MSLNLNLNQSSKIANVPAEHKIRIDSERAQQFRSMILNFIVPIVSVVLCIVLIALVIVPIYKEIPLIRQEIVTHIQKKADLELKLTNLDKLEQYKSVLDENLELINRVLVNSSEEPKFSDQLLQIAESAGLVVDRLITSGTGSSEGRVDSTGAPMADKAGAVKTINASVGATGNLDQLELFLAEIENAARFVSVSSFRFSSASKESAPNNFNFTISLDGPYLAVNSSASVDDAVDAEITTKNYQDFITKVKSLEFYEFSNLVLTSPTPPAPVAPVAPAAPAVQGAKTSNSSKTDKK